ncbi:MAG: tRNA (adenosine(37)-N6)-dimethylallyltransferase MiaA, partial [Mailhella sp.]|nr:tRNA (adenosine(37)-N6)-dimethylallyltransferase MiaA [Mailhella sp.]
RIMLEMGALDEARKALLRCDDVDAPAWTGIGCAETAALLLGQISPETCMERWTHNTRAYAKRQWTWFRADKRILWHRPGEHRELERKVLEFLGR